MDPMTSFAVTIGFLYALGNYRGENTQDKFSLDDNINYTASNRFYSNIRNMRVVDSDGTLRKIPTHITDNHWRKKMQKSLDMDFFTEQEISNVFDRDDKIVSLENIAREEELSFKYQ